MTRADMLGLGLKVDTASLAIGIGIGIVGGVLAVFGLQSMAMTQPSDNNPIDTFLVNSNRTHFFMSGHIKEITADYMVLDQTFGHPEYTDNPNVKVRLDRGAAFLNCYDEVAGQSAQDPESCSKTITGEQIADGLLVCALTRIYGGEFYAGKTWLNSACGPFQNEVTQSANESSAVIVIPEGSSIENSERNNFEPETITVVIGLNNTVTWVNEDDVALLLSADDPAAYPSFAEALCLDSNGLPGDYCDGMLIPPAGSFTYTFEKPGEIGYYGKPWMRGTIVVVSSSTDSNNPDYSRLPAMSMFVHTSTVEGEVSEWEGELGSYCWANICADTDFIIPENLIEIKKGSTIAFQVSNNKQPDELGALVYRGANRLADQQLTPLADGKYLVDLASGSEYILFVGASWMDGDYSAGSAVYYYKIKVT